MEHKLSEQSKPATTIAGKAPEETLIALFEQFYLYQMSIENLTNRYHIIHPII